MTENADGDFLGLETTPTMLLSLQSRVTVAGDGDCLTVCDICSVLDVKKTEHISPLKGIYRPLRAIYAVIGSF